MSELRWTRWRKLPEAGRFYENCLSETLDGGQAFRWNREADGTWTGQWGRFVCRLRRTEDGGLSWSAPEPLATETRKALRVYFAADLNWDSLRDSLPWRSDARLAGCVETFPTLRILRQPFGETLLGFLCSATKQIVQIKQMCRNLAVNFGPEIAPAFHALPDWHKLATVPENELRDCGLGFRAAYIKATALLLAEEPGLLEKIETLPYAEAREQLVRFPGVGEKIADCVLLFGAGRMEAFPVDVWILRTMETRYGLEGWTNAQIAHFGRVHFGPLAGFAQQFLFAAERKESRSRNETVTNIRRRIGASGISTLVSLAIPPVEPLSGKP